MVEVRLHGMRFALRLGLGLGLGAAAAAPCFAQNSPQPTVQELQRTIEELRRRVDALERQGAPAAPPASAPAEQSSAQRAPVAPASPGRQRSVAKGPASEDETIARALERSLVQQGGLLLPRSTYEIVPQLGYFHQSSSQFTIANNGNFGPATSRRDNLEADLTFRAGLPYDSQIDVTLPFVWDARDNTFFGRTASQTSTGIGDVGLALSKQLLYEHGWVPDLVGTVRYQAATGTASFNAGGQIGGTGAGAPSLQGSLTFVKRQDPLAFIGGLDYTHTFIATEGPIAFAAGDAIGVRAGVTLAASPDTSLRFSNTTSFLGRQSINGARVAGSDQVISFLEIGASSLISPSVFVDFGVGVGMTKDTPDFRAVLSVPVRF